MVIKKESLNCNGSEYILTRTLNGLSQINSKDTDISKINASVDNYSFTLSVDRKGINTEIQTLMNCAREKYTIIISEENPIKSEESKSITCYFSDPYKQKIIQNCKK